MASLKMTAAQREAFLSEPRIGVFTAARAGAAPLAAPVWYGYEPGGDVIFAFESTSEKAKLVESAGEASLCVQSEEIPYKYVTVEGPVVASEPDRDVERSLAHRYLGPELGDMYLESTAGSVSVVVRLTPARWRTVDYTASLQALAD